MPLDKAQVSKILYDNADKSFVERIIFPDKGGILDNQDGSFSTHSMSTAEVDGKHIVFPTVLTTKDGLRRFEANDAIRNVLKTGNFIEFDDPEEALSFSHDYKSFWKGGAHPAESTFGGNRPTTLTSTPNL